MGEKNSPLISGTSKPSVCVLREAELRAAVYGYG
jgi:hypothetical protein